MAANGLVGVEAARLLDDSVGASTLDLVTAMGGLSATPTKVTGGSYSAQVPTWNSASNTALTKTNSALVTFSGLPTATVVGVDLKNTSGGDRRWFAPFASSISAISGDSITFAITTGLVFTFANGT